MTEFDKTEKKPKVAITPELLRKRAQEIEEGKLRRSNILLQYGPKQRGWKYCSSLGYFFPPEMLVCEYAYGAHALTQNEEQATFSLKRESKGQRDDVVSRYLKNDILVRGKLTNCFDENGDTLKFCSQSTNYYTEKGLLFSTTYRRGKHCYTTFPTGFSDHRASKFVANFDTLVFGIEIEMKFDTLFNKLLFSKWILDNYQEKWACERDGSLEDSGGAGDCGFELVSSPNPISYYQKHLPVILEKAVSLGAIAYKAGSYYGTHITTNIVSSVVADRFVWMINSIKYRTFWQSVACRSGQSFNHYCPFMHIPHVEGALNTQRVPHSEHKRATYARNFQAVETRIFQANLHPVPAIAYIEVLERLHAFCSMDNFNMNDWFPFLEETASDNLMKFFKDFGIDKIISNEKTREKFE